MCPSPALQCLLSPSSAHHGCVLSQAKYDALKKQMESMEMEVMEARLIRAAELNGELDDDDSGTASLQCWLLANPAVSPSLCATPTAPW